MLKKVKIFVTLLSLVISLAIHHQTFAVDSEESNNFLDKNQKSLFNVGIKSWFRFNKRIIQTQWVAGPEIAIGTVVEWHPLNGIGIGSGLIYSYNVLPTISFSIDNKLVAKEGIIAFGREVYDQCKKLSLIDKGFIINATLHNTTFHAVSLPLHLRLYPDHTRSLIVYAGVRLMLVLPTIHHKDFFPVSVDTGILKEILADVGQQVKDKGSDITNDEMTSITKEGFSRALDSIFATEANPGKKLFTNPDLIYLDLVYDFGVEFRWKSGLVIGTNGLGLVLGYDFLNFK